MELVDVTVHYLEMRAPAPRTCPPPQPDLTVVRELTPAVETYRSLYQRVGEDYRWLSRRKLTDAELVAIIHDPLVETHLLKVAGETGGFAELDCRQPGEIEIVQFGLLPQFIGKGLGKWFLNKILENSWSRGPHRVWLHTCMFDHPAALPNYQQAGFRLYRTETIRREY